MWATITIFSILSLFVNPCCIDGIFAVSASHWPLLLSLRRNAAAGAGVRLPW